MNSSRKFNILLVFISTSLILSCQSNDGWTKLFNGKNFDGWEIKVKGFDLNNNYRETYTVEDGVIKVSYDKYDSFDDKDGNIFYTREKFMNYHLKLEYMFYGEHVRDNDWSYRNSGVMLHSENPKNIPKNQGVPVSIEAQFLGGLGNRKDGVKTTLNMCSPGTDVNIGGETAPNHCMRSKAIKYPKNEWVGVDIIVYNDSIIHHIIGKDTVMTYTNIRYANDEYYSENFKDMIGKPLSEGYIALQSEGHPVKFRNIMIKVLD
tara:strand:+ start:5704 stop:6489 length:786 start_codon:yes stop_codon:yes gene_type:complete